MLFCKWRGGAKACRLTPCKQVTLKIRARVRDDCANTGQAAGATGYSSGTPVAQCQRHKDRTIEAVLSSGCLQVFCGNEKTPGATRYPCPLLRSLSLSRSWCPSRHTQLLARAAGEPAPDAPSSTTGCWWVCPGHPAPTSALTLLNTTRGGRRHSSSSGRSSSGGCTASAETGPFASMG